MKTNQMNIQMPTQNKSLETQPKVQPKVVSQTSSKMMEEIKDIN